MTEMFGEAWSPMSVPDLAPDDDDDVSVSYEALDDPLTECWSRLLVNPVACKMLRS